VYSAYHCESGRPFPGPDVWIDICTVSVPDRGWASPVSNITYNSTLFRARVRVRVRVRVRARTTRARALHFCFYYFKRYSDSSCRFMKTSLREE
jgi:hypothetical protein